MTTPMAPDYVLVDLFAGRISTIAVGRTIAVITINSFVEMLQRPMPRNLYGSQCRFTLFDAGCQLVRASFAVSGAVASLVTNNGNFRTNLTNPDDYFSLGMLTWVTGNNAPLSRSIKTYVHPSNGTIQLSAPMPYTVQIGDTFTAYPGCDKTRDACTDKFNNLANFGGQPFIPSPESAI